MELEGFDSTEPNMRFNPRKRKWVRDWRVKLAELADTIDYDKPANMDEITGLLQGMLEESILGLLNMTEPENVASLLQNTLDNIVASDQSPRHWRHDDTAKIRQLWHERQRASLTARPPRNRLH